MGDWKGGVGNSGRPTDEIRGLRLGRGDVGTAVEAASAGAECVDFGRCGQLTLGGGVPRIGVLTLVAHGVIGSTADSDSVSRGSSPCGPIVGFRSEISGPPAMGGPDVFIAVNHCLGWVYFECRT